MKTFGVPIKDIPDMVINSVVPLIESYTVLLIHRGSLAGSGTFVCCNDAFGILTAHHVVEKNNFDFRAGSGDRLGLAIDRKEHAFSLSMDYLTRIDIGVPIKEDEGPDMTFIQIPTGPELGMIKAKKSFWNLRHDRENRMKVCMSTSGAWCLSYHADERTEKEQIDTGIILTLPASVGWGGQRRTYEIHGFDYFEMGLDPPDAIKGVPDSFGGASGGGVWKVPLSGNRDQIKTGKPLLAGVIFYQTIERTIICHGPKSIYERLYKTLIAQFKL
jgi:hypothetical protein